MGQKVEACTPRDVFWELISVAGEDIHIGGQALSVLTEIYGVKWSSVIVAV